MFIGSFTALPGTTSGGGTFTLVSPPASSSISSSSGGGVSAYQSPGSGGGVVAQGTDLSDYPATRFRGVFGEEFSEGNSPVSSLLKSRNAALLAIAIFGVLLLKDK